MEQAERKASDLRILSAAERILSQVRPFLKSEGSNVSTSDFRDGRLFLKVEGACVGCSLASHDFGELTEMLKEEISDIKEIVFLNPFGLPIF